MKKFRQPYLYIFFQMVLSIGLIFSFEGCINECDSTNSTIVIMEFDTLGTVVNIKHIIFSPSNDTLDSLVSKTTGTFLDLSKDSTLVTFDLYYPKLDTVPRRETILFTYSRKPFSRGPDCGFDVKISDLKIKSYTTNIIDTVYFVSSELTSANLTNVKISLQ